MSSQTPPSGARSRAWNRITNAALVIGALVTAYLVYLAFATVY